MYKKSNLVPGLGIYTINNPGRIKSLRMTFTISQISSPLESLWGGAQIPNSSKQISPVYHLLLGLTLIGAKIPNICAQKTPP
jgi:hypothetical protein